MSLKQVPIEMIQSMCKNTLMEHLKIEFTALGPDYLMAKMPVTPEVHQPMGLLHGGASVALAESVASAASWLLIDPDKESAVGTNITAQHLKSARSGMVYAKAVLLHAGSTSHFWEIKITNEADELICVCNLGVRVLKRK